MTDTSPSRNGNRMLSKEFGMSIEVASSLPAGTQTGGKLTQIVTHTGRTSEGNEEERKARHRKQWCRTNLIHFCGASTSVKSTLDRRPKVILFSCFAW